MSETRVVVVTAHVSPEVRDELRRIAERYNRTPGKQIAWVLERYVRSEGDDGA